MTTSEWRIRVNINDAAAVTIGRTVHPSGDAATPEQCKLAFAAALPQFIARAVAGRYAQALADRATAHANDLASAVVDVFPATYDPTQFVSMPTEPNDPPGPAGEFMTGPAADPAFRVDLSVDVPFAGFGDLLATAPEASTG